MMQPAAGGDSDPVLLNIIVDRGGAGTSLAQQNLALAWCERSNLIAAATNQGRKKSKSGTPTSDSDSVRIHIVDPEAPATHAIISVKGPSSSGPVCQLAWSPARGPRALLCLQSKGLCTILAPPAFAVHSINAWETATQWSDQEALQLAKWLHPPSPFAWSSTSIALPFEDRFLASSPASLTRWPRSGFSCLCTLSKAGSARLHYQTFGRDSKSGQAAWQGTQSVPLNCGPEGSLAADANVSVGGSVLVALIPSSQPSTVVVWELLPSNHNTQISTGASTLSPLVSALLRPTSDKQPAALSASIVSSFSVEQGALNTRRIGGISFEEGVGGERLVVLTCGLEGDKSVALERWQSSGEPLQIHEVFRTSEDPKDGLETVTKWTKVASAELKELAEDDISGVQLSFSSTRDQLAVSTAQRTHFYHVRPDFTLEALPTPHLDGPAAAFSPTGACVAALLPGGKEEDFLNSIAIAPACPWDGRERMLGEQRTTDGWDLALSQRCLWGFVTSAFCWDVVLVARKGPGSITGLGGQLDRQLHALPGERHRREYGKKLDRLKMRLLAGVVGPEKRAVSLETRMRLVLESLTRALLLLLTRAPGAGGEEGYAELEGWCQDSILDLASLFIHVIRRNVDVYLAHQAAANSPSDKRPTVEAAFPGLPGTRLVGDRGFLEGLSKVASGARMLKQRRDEKALPAENKSGQGNGGAGYRVTEMSALLTVVQDLAKKTLTLPAHFPQSPAHPDALALHYADGWSSIGWEEVNKAIHAVLTALPRPPGADSVGMLLRSVDVLVSWDLPTNEIGFDLVDEFPPQSYLTSMGFIKTEDNLARDSGRKRRRAENAVATGKSGKGHLRAILGSRKDTLDFRWKEAASPGMVWCGGCGKSTACHLQGGGSESDPDRAQKWKSSWGAHWATSCPLCMGSWHAAV